MNWIKNNTTQQTVQKRAKELRQFALVVGTGFLLLSGVLFLKQVAAWIVLVWVAGVLLLLGLVAPKTLLPLEWLWMKFAHYLALVITPVLVTFIFFVVVTPLGLLLHLLRKDLLSLKWDRDIRSYWVKVEDDAPGTRPFSPY